MSRTSPQSFLIRNLVIVLGDQLDSRSAALDGFDEKHDAIWMAEVGRESTKVWTHQARIAVFLAAMRHFAAAQRASGRRVLYRALDDPENAGTLGGELARTMADARPEKLIVVEPGEWSVREELVTAAAAAGMTLEMRPDRDFICSREEFVAHAKGRKQLRMEFFYREMRRKTGVLMEGDEPAGGQWNFDHDNRGSFGKNGPGLVPPRCSFPPDEITREVLKLVAQRFPDHPGKLTHFDWPVTSAQARVALERFISQRLSEFGHWEDAMWTDEAWLWHSHLSVALNLKLLDPREVLAAAERAYQEKLAPLASVEGFVRQILGWREFVRGIYWHLMPEYVESNALGASQPLPKFYWTGETDMNCLRHAIGQTLEFGYAHHIQRLMVTGLFALLLGVHPRRVHEWYLAVYVDAVEWVELPNTLGMSQYADGGVMASKPYIASGKYLQRMSNYCAGCRYDPGQRTGPKACPFTTLYWDFLLRHEESLARNPRMVMQVRNLQRLTLDVKTAVLQQAEHLREGYRMEAK